MAGSRIVKKLSLEEYQELIRAYKEKIHVSPDALFRLSQGQRKVFKEETLIHMLTRERPRLAGIQENGRYTAFFRRNYGFTRIIFAIEDTRKLEIITFVITENLPLINDGT